jgi:Ca2+-binding EF-hand superfamily protein
MTNSALRAVLLGISLIAFTTPLMATDRDPVREAFAAMDSNADGKITRDEFELNKVNVIFRRSVGRGASLRYEDTLVSRATFDAIDIDGDGLVTASDVREAPFFKFDAFDRNGDHHIDLAEFQALLSSLGQPGSSADVGR